MNAVVGELTRLRRRPYVKVLPPPWDFDDHVDRRASSRTNRWRLTMPGKNRLVLRRLAGAESAELPLGAIVGVRPPNWVLLEVQLTLYHGAVMVQRLPDGYWSD